MPSGMSAQPHSVMSLARCKCHKHQSLQCKGQCRRRFRLCLHRPDRDHHTRPTRRVGCYRNRNCLPEHLHSRTDKWPFTPQTLHCPSSMSHRRWLRQHRSSASSFVQPGPPDGKRYRCHRTRQTINWFSPTPRERPGRIWPRDVPCSGDLHQNLQLALANRSSPCSARTRTSPSASCCKLSLHLSRNMGDGLRRLPQWRDLPPTMPEVDAGPANPMVAYVVGQPGNTRMLG